MSVCRSIQVMMSGSRMPSKKKTSAEPALMDRPSRTSSLSISAADRTGTSRPLGAATSLTRVESSASTS